MLQCLHNNKIKHKTDLLFNEWYSALLQVSILHCYKFQFQRNHQAVHAKPLNHISFSCFYITL